MFDSKNYEQSAWCHNCKKLFDREVYVGRNQSILISRFIKNVDMNHAEFIIFHLILGHA